MGRKLKLTVLESTPCTRPWGTLEGGARERYCDACDKHVHNFSAMTAREIERLVREREGRLCARVAYLPDGSIRTIEGASHPSVATSVVLAASLAFSTSAFAKSQGNASVSEKAMLTGIVLDEAGSAPLAGAVVGLHVDGQTIAVTKADAQGKFTISADPGQYEISVGRSIFFGVRIYGADLHAGEQSLQPIRYSSEYEHSAYPFETVTDGEIVVRYRYPISYLFKHPLRYLKHLPHNF